MKKSLFDIHNLKTIILENAQNLGASSACNFKGLIIYFLGYSGVSETLGLLQMHLDEPVKLAMCFLLQHLCDSQLRHRVESIINFSDDFVAECQAVSALA